METVFDWSKITDDTMFENVMKDPVTCKLLIEAILPDLKINEIEVHTQKRVRDDKKEKLQSLMFGLKMIKAGSTMLKCNWAKRKEWICERGITCRALIVNLFMQVSIIPSWKLLM